MSKDIVADTNGNTEKLVSSEIPTFANIPRLDAQDSSFFNNFLPSINKVWRGSVLSNSLAVLVVRGTTILLRLIIVFVIAGFATPNEFGRVAYSIAIAEIARVVADFGIDTLSIREFSILRMESERQIYASAVAITKLILGVIIYLLFLVFFLLTRREVTIDIEAISGLLILTGLGNNLFFNYFQACLGVTKIVFPVFVNGVVMTILVVIVFLLKPNIFLMLSLLPFSELVNFCMLSRFFRKEIRFVKEGLYFENISRLLKRGFPIAITTVCVVFYTRLDVVILSYYFDATTVGYYGIAYRMTEPVQFIAGAFSVSIYSHISTSLVNKCHDLRELMRRYIFGTLIYGMISCLLLVVFAPIIIKELFPGYIPAIPVLQVLAMALIFRTLNNSLTAIIQAHGYFTKITIVAIWNLVLIGTILWFCVPRMGAVGAAVALLVGEIVNTILQLYITKRIITK
ncbi:membrane hypothetical protein [Gammaproteobacteria bacterium]